MYAIIPYQSIGNFKLGSSISLINDTLGKGQLERSPFFEDTIIGKYKNGVSIEFKLEKAAFIGVIINLNPVLENFIFSDRTFEDILVFFRSFPSKIYTDYSVLISDHLGITCYFEDDQLKEVGIFSEGYRNQLIGDLQEI